MGRHGKTVATRPAAWHAQIERAALACQRQDAPAKLGLRHVTIAVTRPDEKGARAWRGTRHWRDVADEVSVPGRWLPEQDELPEAGPEGYACHGQQAVSRQELGGEAIVVHHMGRKAVGEVEF